MTKALCAYGTVPERGIEEEGRDEGSNCIGTLLSIDAGMIPSKLLFYTLGSCIGSYRPYINVFLVSVGLSKGEAGFLSGISGIVSSIAGPILCGLIDFTGYRRLVFIMLCLGHSATIFSLPWVAADVPSHGNFTNMDQKRLIHTASANEMSNPSSDIFYYMLVLVPLGGSLLFPLVCATDVIVVNALENRHSQSDYGAQRMFRPVGISCASLIAGIAADHYRNPIRSRYAAVFFVFMPFGLLLIPSFLMVFADTNWESEGGETKEMLLNPEEKNGSNRGNVSRGTISDIKSTMRAFKTLDNLFMLLCVFIAGVVKEVGSYFLFLMVEEMNGSRTMMGSITFVSGITGTLMHLFSKKVIKLLGGNVICIEVCLLVYILRVLIISFIKDAWLVIPVEMIYCSSKALFVFANVDYTKEISTGNNHTTILTVFTGMYVEVSLAVANMLGGVLYGSFGGRTLFQGTSLFGGSFLIGMVIYFHGNTITQKRFSVLNSKSS